MDFSNFAAFAEFVTNGFQKAIENSFANFTSKQEARDMAFQDKLQQILEAQNASTQLSIAIKDAVDSEATQVTGIISAQTQTIAAQQQTITDLQAQVTALLEQVQNGEATLADLETKLDEVFQGQQAVLTGQQEALTKIGAIYEPTTAEAPTEETPAA